MGGTVMAMYCRNFSVIFSTVWTSYAADPFDLSNHIRPEWVIFGGPDKRLRRWADTASG